MSKHVHQHTDIMLDLETFGTGKDAAIVSIGAVAFMADEGPLCSLFNESPEGLRIDGLGFHRRVSLAISDPAKRGVIDPATVEWWLQQSNEARASLTMKPRTSLGTALQDFYTWINENFAKPRRLRLWSNGPTFDERLIREAFDRYGREFPISFRGSRCCRTMIELAEQHGWDRSQFKELSSYILKHNALHDAVFQARGVVLQRHHLAGMYERALLIQTHVENVPGLDEELGDIAGGY